MAWIKQLESLEKAAEVTGGSHHPLPPLQPAPAHPLLLTPFSGEGMYVHRSCPGTRLPFRAQTYLFLGCAALGLRISLSWSLPSRFVKKEVVVVAMASG